MAILRFIRSVYARAVRPALLIPRWALAQLLLVLVFVVIPKGTRDGVRFMRCLRPYVSGRSDLSDVLPSAG